MIYDLQAPWVGCDEEEYEAKTNPYYGWNESEDDIVAKCDECGEKVRSGEEYYDFNGRIVCGECLAEYLSSHRGRG